MTAARAKAVERDRGETERGTVRFFDVIRGFGFIRPDAGGEDVFIHMAALERAGLTTLNAGDRIEYQRMRDRRGWQAWWPRLVERRANEQTPAH